MRIRSTRKMSEKESVLRRFRKVTLFTFVLGESVSLKGWVLILAEEKAMAPHPSTLAWKIPWTEEPGGLQSMGSLRVGHD